jgi:hypothetical protein
MLRGLSIHCQSSVAAVRLRPFSQAAPLNYGGSPIPVELLDRAVWRFLKGKRHLTASASFYTNWRTALGKYLVACAGPAVD